MGGHHVRGFYLGTSGNDVCPEIVLSVEGCEWRRKKKTEALTFKVKLVDVFQRLVDKVKTSKSLEKKKNK